MTLQRKIGEMIISSKQKRNIFNLCCDYLHLVAFSSLLKDIMLNLSIGALWVPQFGLQNVIEVQNRLVCVANHGIFVEYPCDLLPREKAFKRERKRKCKC